MTSMSKQQILAHIEHLSEEDLQLAAAWLARLRSGHGAFGGAVGRYLAMRFTDCSDGRCTVELDVGPEFWNPLGTLHGSITHALIDTSMGGAVASLIGEGNPQATVELKVSYLRPFQEGLLIATSEVVHQGKRIWFLESQVHDEQDNLIATGNSTFYVS